MGIVLHLPMNAVWYEMVESLQKTHEYRDITPYWISRLVKKPYVNMIKVNCKDAWHREKYSDNELAEYIESLAKQWGNDNISVYVPEFYCTFCSVQEYLFWLHF